eukprot:71525_1
MASMNKSKEHLVSWIRTNKIKHELLKKDILSECMQSILQLYGSDNEILDCLIQRSPKERLDEMYKIFKKSLGRFRMNSTETAATQSTLKMDMNRISSGAIETICSFLTRPSIISFKLCNRRTSIVCLTEMMKTSISIRYANQFLNTKLKPYAKCIVNLQHNPFDVHRFDMKNTYSFMMHDSVSKHSHIPIAVDTHDVHHVVSTHTIYPKSSLIIFNKSDIAFIQSDDIRQMTRNDCFIGGKHIILALHCFNVIQQELVLLEYLVINRSIALQRLLHYIMNVLIPSNPSETLDELKELLATENDKNNIKLTRGQSHTAHFEIDQYYFIITCNNE